MSAVDNAAPELLPCPFCAGDAEWGNGQYGDGTQWSYITCSDCEAIGGSVSRAEYTDAKAIAAWNRRADLAAPSAQEGQPITMTYRNYRGEVADRTVTPKRIWWGSTDWHPEPGWLMTAYDPEKHADRDFALADADFRRVAPSAPAENERLREALTEIANAYTAQGYLDAMDAVQHLKDTAKGAIND